MINLLKKRSKKTPQKMKELEKQRLAAKAEALKAINNAKNVRELSLLMLNKITEDQSCAHN